MSESVISGTCDGLVTGWNLAAATLYGYHRDEAIGRALADLVGPLPDEILPQLKSGGIWEGYVERNDRKGHRRHVRMKISLDDSGERHEWLEVTSLVDGGHPAELALAQTEYRYRNLFGAVAASFWELDFEGVGRLLAKLRKSGVENVISHLRNHPELGRELISATRIVDTNERSSEMFGPAKKQDLLATPLNKFWPDESVGDFIDCVIAAISGKPRHVMETRMRALGGRVFDALLTVSFLPGTVGDGTLLVGFTDISDRVQATRKLGEASRRRKMLMDVPTLALCELSAPESGKEFYRLREAGVTDIVAYIDEHPEFVDFAIEDLRLTAVNDAAVRLFGAKDAEDLIGRRMTGIIPAGSEILRRSIEGSWDREPVFQSEMPLTTLIGEQINTLFCRITDPDPWSADVLVALIDITEQTRARDEAERTGQQVAHASRISLLGQLTASLVHEISQPITAISTSAAAAVRMTDQAQPNLRQIGKASALIGQHAKRAGEIIQRMRAVAANRPVPMVPLRVGELVAETRLLLRQELNERSVRLVVETSPGLPPVLGDRVQLQQILANLLLNAAQAMDVVPKPRRRLAMWAAPHDGGVQIGVTDGGPGLSKEFLENPFRPFASSKPDGLGIGLSICNSIAGAHGGRLSFANNEEGQGATFTLWLPASESALPG